MGEQSVDWGRHPERLRPELSRLGSIDYTGRMLEKVTIVCFAASYGTALLLEVSRLFFRLPVRLVVMLGFAGAGLLAHTIFLYNHAQSQQSVPFSSWHAWFLVAAWILVVLYLAMAISRPQASIGIFMLPVVLALILAATFADPQATFPRSEALSLWYAVHGLALLLGTVTAALGFVAGLMYLVQSYRLKHKLPPRPGFRLPSLEWLQSMNRQTLYVSAVLVAGGMFAGIVLNVIRVEKSVPWSDRVIVSSGILLGWLFAATLFELFYKPAQQGRKVAYLTVANFVFLGAVLWIVLFSGSEHANASDVAQPAEEVRSPSRPISQRLMAEGTP